MDKKRLVTEKTNGPNGPNGQVLLVTRNLKRDGIEDKVRVPKKENKFEDGVQQPYSLYFGGTSTVDANYSAWHLELL